MKTIVAAIVALAVIGVTACSGADSPAIVVTPGECTLHGLSVSPATATLHVGDTLTLSAKGASCPQDGSTTQPRWTWRSSDSLVATVDSSSGLVRARANGSTTVISALVSDPSIQAAGNITVVP